MRVGRWRRRGLLAACAWRHRAHRSRVCGQGQMRKRRKLLSTHFPISLKSKFPSYPNKKPVRVIKSFASGGWTSTKYCVLMYLDANFPKWTSSKLKLGFRVAHLIDIGGLHDAIRFGNLVKPNSTGYQHDENQQFPLSRRNVQAARRMSSKPARAETFRCCCASFVRIQVRLAGVGKSLGCCDRGRRCRVGHSRRWRGRPSSAKVARHCGYKVDPGQGIRKKERKQLCEFFGRARAATCRTPKMEVPCRRLLPRFRGSAD